MKRHVAKRAARASAIVAIALAALGLGMAGYLSTSSASTLVPPHMLFSPVSTLAFSIAGALIASRQLRNPVGWLFLLAGLLSALVLWAGAYYGVSQLLPLPLSGFSLWLQAWVWIPSTLIPLTLVLLLFPDGKLPSRRWWPVLLAAVLGLTGVSAALGLHPDASVQESLGLPAANPYVLAGAGRALNSVLYLSGGLAVVAVCGAVAAVILRYRRSQGIQRTQMKWLAYAGVFVIAGLLAASLLAAVYPGDPAVEEMTIILSNLAVAGVAAACGVAIVRHGLFDIDLLLNRTLVYLGLTAGVIGIYTLVVGLLGALFRSGGNLTLSLIATGVVAVGIQPLRTRLQMGVNRLLYGARDDPYAVISRLGERLGSLVAPEAVLPTLTETIAHALKLPYVAIFIKGSEGLRLAAAYGERGGKGLELPLRYQSEELGRLLISPRSPGESFTPTERKLLEDVARQASVAVHTTRLTRDLLHAHRQLLRAREEERRRIRRDLHDGLGTRLASHRLSIGSALQAMDQDPAAARAVLVELEQGVTQALEDIRRLVYGLRPPALDELGLVRALQQSTPRVPETAIDYDVPRPIPELPAAVDVAAYRIVQEALTNCIRHAQASQVTVGITANLDLKLSIRDDGCGLPPESVPGVGLTSMRARAEELGGTLDIISNPRAGTEILVRLPLEEPSRPWTA